MKTQTKTKTEDMVIIDGLEVIDGVDLNTEGLERIMELKKGGVKCVHACCGFWDNARETLHKIGQWRRFFVEHKDLVMQVKNGDDLTKSIQEDKVGVILGAQNISAIEDELALVDVFNELGIKIMQLTYNNQSLVGGSCYEENDSGLSRFGKLVIKEMNRVGMIIDLSHVGERTSLDAIQTSTRPVAITHANPAWIYPARRNKSKEVLTELRNNSGILGLCAYPHVINGPGTTLDEFTDMIVQTIDFMGIDHVAIGSDKGTNMSNEYLKWMRMGRWTHEMDYGAGSKQSPNRPPSPSWFKGPSDFPNIVEGLYKKGMSTKEVSAVMGGNWINFFSEGFKKEGDL